MSRTAPVIATVLLVLLPACSRNRDEIVVGSKLFTESVILGDIATQLLRSEGLAVRHRREFGGSRLLFEALQRGELDLYPEYTGTLRLELLRAHGLRSDAQIPPALAALDLAMSAPLGFNNSYALGVRPATAQRLGLRTISDLRAHPELRFGFSNEFMERGDGWPALRAAYQLPQTRVNGLDHALAYIGIANDQLDVIDVYTTDAEIAYYDLVLLEDDRGHFPRYDAVWLYRADLETRHAAALPALHLATGAFDDAKMAQLNARAKPPDGRPRVDERLVARDFVESEFGRSAEFEKASRPQRILRRTREHLRLVGLSMLYALLLALPLGICAARFEWLGQPILGAVGVLQTIPSLALLVLLIAPLAALGVREIGEPQAITALCIYSLLPIVRNTYTGIRGIAPPLRESAAALGLSASTRLWRIELPLASPVILAGIKTAVVINIGFATLGALIGAGGYGQPILTGIRLSDTPLILEGALPAAALALLAQGLFELIERWCVPRGLRLKAAT